MPKLPDDWLGWISLIGSLGGLLVIIRFIVNNFAFNLFQIRAILAADQSSSKTIHIIKPLGGEVIFHLDPKIGDIPNDYYHMINKSKDSNANLAYLDELCRRKFFTSRVETSELGSMHVKNELYILTSRGMRFARIFRFFHYLYGIAIH